MWDFGAYFKVKKNVKKLTFLDQFSKNDEIYAKSPDQFVVFDRITIPGLIS
jgi:hypothetical protein